VGSNPTLSAIPINQRKTTFIDTLLASCTEATEVSCETRPVCEKHYLHRLRKTCATRWLRNGIDLMTLRSWLGHKSLAVTQIYLEDVRNIDTSMQAKLDRAGSYSN